MNARNSCIHKAGRHLFTALGIVSLFLGITSTGWLVLIVDQWALPWKSLAVMAPPPAPQAARQQTPPQTR